MPPREHLGVPLAVFLSACGSSSPAPPAVDAGRDGSSGVATTMEDFHVPGTQIGDLDGKAMPVAETCISCHEVEKGAAAFDGWEGSLMGIAGRDPLFKAQLATATQDAPGVGYFCLRCHVPVSIATGHAADPKALDPVDADGVNCAFCHAMVDPKSTSLDDAPLLAKLVDRPKHYGNAQFVLDATRVWRGPYELGDVTHPTRKSDFLKTSEMCGTCHEVGNPVTIRNADGTYSFDTLGTRAKDADPAAQFPLERTFTEWRLSAFAKGGVDMAGRFGGDGGKVVSTCQDCHMPRTAAKGATFSALRPDLARHDFAGASAWVLRIAAKEFLELDPEVLEVGATRAEAMVKKAASLELSQLAKGLRVKVVNESGHKLPTGHIEGRRVWVSVRVLDAKGALLKAYGAYDPVTAELDEASTTVFEMHVGLSPIAAALTGYPSGATTHMSLADTIVKDTRIPPRGFDSKAFAAAGAPTVGFPYVDGQHWAEVDYALPAGATLAQVTVFYQTVTKHYVEALRTGNRTDAWGEKLHDLWTATDKCPPIAIVSKELALR